MLHRINERKLFMQSISRKNERFKKKLVTIKHWLLYLFLFYLKIQFDGTSEQFIENVHNRFELYNHAICCRTFCCMFFEKADEI